MFVQLLRYYITFITLSTSQHAKRVRFVKKQQSALLKNNKMLC